MSTSQTFISLACTAALAVLASSSVAYSQTGKPPKLDNILYGAAYYNEYVPAPIADGRLEKDIALMKRAGINVVRLGESTWDKWEPEDGRIDFAWMDRIVDAMGKAGIKVIMGTPTYSIPVWMYARHPDMLARPLGGGETGYGMRQNMNIDDPNYRRYAERIITAMAQHYRDNPNVIGWQLDNETSGYDASNASVHADFVTWLKAKYGTTDALNKAWLLSYWGQEVHRWEDMPTRDKANSTSFKLDWTRFQQWRATRFIAWQAQLVRANARSDQFITHNHPTMTRTEFNPVEMDKVLDVVGNDIYFDWQDRFNGWKQTFQGDLARSLHHRNWFLNETNAQTQGWDATSQLPPYDGQTYQDVFGHIANGANMVSYWHWASLHGGQETYWKGVLGHDLEPNRAYAEVSRVGGDLKRVGSKLVDLKRKNEVAILYSIDSFAALEFMPYSKAPPAGEKGFHTDGYRRVVEQLHNSLYDANVGTDFVFADQADFSGYKLLVVPPLYIADDALLQKISDYVKNGGNVLMTYKSAVANENSLVRWTMAPGPLRAAAGFHHQENSTLLKPLKLKGDPFAAGDDNEVRTIAEFLEVETAKPLAFYDHPFFGKWPAITRNQYGKGSFLYEGTELSDALQAKIVGDELKRIGLLGGDQQLPDAVRIKHATSREGKKLHFYFNYSQAPVTVSYSYRSGKELLKDAALASGGQISLSPWGVAVAEER